MSLYGGCTLGPAERLCASAALASKSGIMINMMERRIKLKLQYGHCIILFISSRQTHNSRSVTQAPTVSRQIALVIILNVFVEAEFRAGPRLVCLSAVASIHPSL
jgi:hypothetical protein